MGAAVAHTETAAIDRWVAPAYEPIVKCRKCDHEVDYHDEYGCYASSWEDNLDAFINRLTENHCDCKGFE